jgi:hypothetical protein
MVYRYINDGAGPGELQDVLATGLNPRRGILWITPNFFRFRDEAIRFLALPQNRAEIGVYLDLGVLSSTLPWRMTQPVGILPGGALELPFARNAPIPRNQIVETFQTEPQQAVAGYGNPAQWNFPFTER